MAFEPIDKDYINRNFNDRRVNGKSKNRAVGENLYNPKKIAELRMQEQKNNQHKPPKRGNGKPDTGGIMATRKPRGPHDPMPARAVAIKHEVKGY